MGSLIKGRGYPDKDILSEMDARARLRTLSIVQILAGLLYVLSALFSLSFFASCSREVAIDRGYDVPPDFKRVFISHRIVYNWPFTKAHQIAGCVVCVATLVLLFLSVWYARRLKETLSH